MWGTPGPTATFVRLRGSPFDRLRISSLLIGGVASAWRSRASRRWSASLGEPGWDMRRTSPRPERPSRAYDPLAEVDPERLKLIGAISLAWNWIEGSIDSSLSVALRLHPSMWFDVTTRINGLDSKFALLKQCATLYLSDMSAAFDETRRQMADTIGEVSVAKKYRDGVIHVRLTAPEELSGEIPVGKGRLDEVLVSTDALKAFYARLIHLRREMDHVTGLFYLQWVVTQASAGDDRRQAAADFRDAQARLSDLHKKRSSLPRLLEFPESPPEHQDPEAAGTPPG